MADTGEMAADVKSLRRQVASAKSILSRFHNQHHSLLHSSRCTIERLNEIAAKIETQQAKFSQLRDALRKAEGRT